ncbi:hypothetical protein LWI28_021660 [Acer negundo]|uniref:Uncharacterized protein n=1 Tax=Acer negundo TaxID=4023 RepID=A0AAD5JAF2_ACENE|nr:hypothetical protein LWI28_021660 [Acer negundo]
MNPTLTSFLIAFDLNVVYDLQAHRAQGADEVINHEVLVSSREASATPRLAKKRVKRNASEVSAKKAKVGGASDHAVVGEALDPIVVGEALDPTRVQQGTGPTVGEVEADLLRDSEDVSITQRKEEVGLVDQKVEVGVAMDGPTSNRTGEYVGAGITYVLEKNKEEGATILPEIVYKELSQTTSSSEGSSPPSWGGMSPFSSLGSIPIVAGTSTGAILPLKGLIYSLEMMMAMASIHSYLGDGDWDRKGVASYLTGSDIF